MPRLNKRIVDKCNPRQRKWLDRWCKIRYKEPWEVIYRGSSNGWDSFTVVLNRHTKPTTKARYGSYGNLTWDKIKKEVRNYDRRIRREKRNSIASYI